MNRLEDMMFKKEDFFIIFGDFLLKRFIDSEIIKISDKNIILLDLCA